MFKIQLSPQAGSRDTVITVEGDVLTIDGTAIDFGPLGEGEQCDTSAPLVGTARRVDGVISVGVLLQYDSATAEPMQSTDAADYLIELTEGTAPDVIARKPITEQEIAPDA
jgi:hypothetical protein